MRSLHIAIACFMLGSTLCTLPAPLRAQTPAPDTEEVRLRPAPEEEIVYTEEDLNEIARTKRPLLLDSFGLRVALGFHGLAKSKQGRPLFYPDISLRHKSGSLYLDARLPVLLGGLDYGQYVLRRDVLKMSRSNMLFLLLNKPAQYAQGEAAMLRVGQIWKRRLGASKDKKGLPIEVSGGLAAIADWVVFETRFLSESLDEEASIQDLIINDPAVVGVGLFGAIAQRRENFHVDLALMVARDVFQWDRYLTLTGFLVSPDLEVTIALGENYGMSFRTRATWYTHVKNPRAFSFQNQTGIVISF